MEKFAPFKRRHMGIAAALGAATIMMSIGTTASAYVLTTEAINDSSATRLAPVRPRLTHTPSTRRAYRARPDPLAGLYTWRNQALNSPAAIDQSMLAPYFDTHATLLSNGRVLADGLPAITSYFQKWQAQGDTVETGLPFHKTFRSGNDVYVYQVTHIRHNGQWRCVLSAGHAQLLGNRISRLDLVETDADAATDATALCGSSPPTSSGAK